MRKLRHRMVQWWSKISGLVTVGSRTHIPQVPGSGPVFTYSAWKLNNNHITYLLKSSNSFLTVYKIGSNGISLTLRIETLYLGFRLLLQDCSLKKLISPAIPYL